MSDERALARGYMALRTTGISQERWHEIQGKQRRRAEREGSKEVEGISEAGMIGTADRTGA